MPHWFDSHAHLDCLGSAEDLPARLRPAREAGVAGWLVPGVAPCDWPQLLAAVRAVPSAFAAPGVHPQAAMAWNDRCRRDLERLLAEAPVAAVGEIGLDALLPVAAATQEAALTAQLQLAVAAGRPIVLHCRRASDRLLRLLDRAGASRVGGIWHAFSGSNETARAAIRRNFALGFGGPLTWPGARRGPEVLRQLPAEWIVLESDLPDLAPAPHRGQENRPEWLPLVGAAVAALRGWSLAETARITAGNARRVLGLTSWNVKDP